MASTYWTGEVAFFKIMFIEKNEHSVFHIIQNVNIVNKIYKLKNKNNI